MEKNYTCDHLPYTLNTCALLDLRQKLGESTAAQTRYIKDGENYTLETALEQQEVVDNNERILYAFNQCKSCNR